MTFGDKLKHLRIQYSLTQEELGKELHTSKVNISRYESNKIEPNLETLKAIAKFFNVSIDYLLDVTNPSFEFEVEKILRNKGITEKHPAYKILKKISVLPEEDWDFISEMIDRMFPSKK